jgi:hypothetical protein
MEWVARVLYVETTGSVKEMIDLGKWQLDFTS